MRANPGGQIAPDEVIGRDRLIERLWDVLEGRSALLVAERRIGKTTVMSKMEKEAPKDVLPIRRDLEYVASPIEFVEWVFKDVEAYLSPMGRGAKRVREFLGALAGAEVGGLFKFPEVAQTHWKELLAKTMEDLAEHQSCRRVVFFWDEIPYMLDAIQKRFGEGAAMEVLDLLRAMRQTHSGLRMVFTGSVGLHHVLASLREQGHSNASVNDMQPVDIDALENDDALLLARLLLDGEEIPCDDREGIASAVALAADKVPFYIHHIVDRLKTRTGPAGEVEVEECVAEFLVDANDPLDFFHYRERLDTYYGKEGARLALAVLDIVAGEPDEAGGLPLNAVLDRVRGTIALTDDEPAREMLRLLGKDHYLIRLQDGAFCFKFPLIRRWWRLNRGL